MNRSFLAGFIGSLSLFLAINLLAAHLRSDCGLAFFRLSTWADAVTRVGWPLQFYKSGGLIYQQDFNALIFITDLLMALALAYALGLLFGRRKKPLPK